MQSAHLPMRVWDMLRSLRDIQAAFAAHFSGHDQLDLVAAIGSDSRTALQRLQLHWHHVTRSVGAALAATFPTVAAVVGQGFFGLLARDFMAGTALSDPVLSRYGEHFPQFLAAKQDMHGLPYLADVARLDWALNVAFHAGLDPRLSAADLAGWPQDSLLSLSARIANGFVVDRIGLSSRSDLAGIATRRAGRQGRSCCRSGLSGVRRPEDAAFVVLAPGEAAFIKHLCRGDPLATAARRATQVAKDFDPAATFGRMLGLRLLTAGTPA